MSRYYRSRSWCTVFVMVIGLLRRCSMFPHRGLGWVPITVTTLMLAVVASVAAVPPSREEVDLPEGFTIQVDNICPLS
jgi:hypothetical protein